MRRMEPAASIIKKLGGHVAVSTYLKTAKNAPYRWTYSKERGGTGGVIPHWHHDDLLKMAADLGIPMSRADLVEMPLTEAAQ